MQALHKAWPASLALVVPVFAGLVWMAAEGAPTAYLAVNAGSLMIAVAAACWLPVPTSERHALWAMLAFLALLGLPIIIGRDLNGVQRWLALGPVNLHIGYLVLPLLVVLTNQLRPALAAALLVAAVAICTLQPDRAAVLALAAAAAARTLQQRDRFTMIALIAAVTALLAVWSMPDPLEPVPFVERVLQDAWATSAAAGAALVLASLAPLVLIKTIRQSALPLVAFVVAASCAALLGAYPAILIGYGAAPILGLGLALAALRRQ